MTQVHIAFYKGTKKENTKSRIMDNIICLTTSSRFSHAELIINYDPTTHIGDCWSSSEWDGGVRNKLMDLNPERWVIVPVESRYTKQELVAFFKAEEGKKYDYFGALGVVFPFVSGSPERWFCFEIVAAALGFVNASRFDADNLLEVIYG